MIELVWLIPAFPLAGFLVLALGGDRFPRNGVATVGVGSVGASAVLAIIIGFEFFRGSIHGKVYSHTLWTWVNIAGFTPSFTCYLDALSLLMVLVVTIVGFLIHLYSAEYMIDDEGYRRFFAYMNLFVAAMLTLVLADNLMLLYLGWEGVGLCSYLLIGFWYKETENVNAAVKAFVMTRIGDTAMLIGLFLLFHSFGTLNIQEILQRAPHEWTAGSQIAVLAAALLLGGALGKSAQLPLQTWLPDAMAGPTPVSALIHAATMVTAGVYLIARTNVLFTLAPVVQSAVAVIGVATLLMAGFSALTQTDIKRVLAYSTISQIGYMFLALGVGAWSAAMFHFLTHACFKSLLFLGAGAIILSAGHEQNMFKLGGLRSKLPVTFWTFFVGAASLAAVPFVTAGFYSKDLVLWSVWASDQGGRWLWAAGAAGALLTGLYTFRMVFLTFFGEAKTPVSHKTGTTIHAPLVVLAVLSVVVGFIELPPSLGDVGIFTDVIETALPATVLRSVDHGVEPLLMIVSSVGCLLGVLAAYLIYVRRPDFPGSLCQTPAIDGLRRFWLAGWGFDHVYDRLFVRPFVWLARINRKDFVDLFPFLISELARAMHEGFALTQTGRVRHYAMGIAIGALVVVGIVVLS